MLSCELELNDDVKKFWEFDSKIAESANERVTILKRMLNAEKGCIKKTKRLQGKYEVPKLWSDKVEELSNNFNTTLKRFRSLRKRIQKDPDMCQNYKDKIQNYIIYEKMEIEKIKPKGLVFATPPSFQ